ncbi:MAG: endonuclease NucS [Coleofasciculus sp. A1-SPW-01]|uniref:endonuclease NucS domain-containing protein n=1 Tax=Coleofasciculus sp. A1-SPW-01 TaxID=3070819 RepID=UPI0032FA11A2
MNQRYQINKTANGWEFANEAVLEDFVWDNLEKMLGWKPLKRQHHVNGNYSDILAIVNKDQLVIIELKNSEDRYVIQQLTRYYDALLKQKPYHDKVNYKLPIRLVVISPNFHADNWVDCKYHRLDFNLFEFSILWESQPRFKIQQLKTNNKYEFDIPYCLDANPHKAREIYPVPRSLKTALSRCSNYNTDILLRIREKLLNFDERIQEIQVNSGHFIFGKGKAKSCAEFKSQQDKRGNNLINYVPVFALWLPISLISLNPQDRLGKVILPEGLFLFNGVNWQEGHSYIYRTLRYMTGQRQKIKNTWEINQYIRFLLSKELNKDIDHNKLDKSIQQYCEQKNLPNPRESNDKCLDFFVEIALEKWQKRL